MTEEYKTALLQSLAAAGDALAKELEKVEAIRRRVGGFQPADPVKEAAVQLTAVTAKAVMALLADAKVKK